MVVVVSVTPLVYVDEINSSKLFGSSSAMMLSSSVLVVVSSFSSKFSVVNSSVSIISDGNFVVSFIFSSEVAVVISSWTISLANAFFDVVPSVVNSSTVSIKVETVTAISSIVD